VTHRFWKSSMCSFWGMATGGDPRSRHAREAKRLGTAPNSRGASHGREVSRTGDDARGRGSGSARTRARPNATIRGSRGSAEGTTRTRGSE
jgi:hypothetical protein